MHVELASALAAGLALPGATKPPPAAPPKGEAHAEWGLIEKNGFE